MEAAAYTAVVNNSDTIYLNRCTIGGENGIGTLRRTGYGTARDDDLRSAGTRRALVAATAGTTAVDAGVVTIEMLLSPLEPSPVLVMVQLFMVSVPPEHCITL